MKIVILGAGAWGTAVATVLANNGHHVTMWAHEVVIAEDINTHHTNIEYLPGFQLPLLIQATNDICSAVCEADIIFEAIPVKFLRSTLMTAISCVRANQTWIVMSKGIEEGTLLLPEQVLASVYPSITKKAVLAGPSFAHEVISEQKTRVVLASDTLEVFSSVAPLLTTTYFSVEFSDDVVGVQLCAALKNVVALAIGILKGLKTGDNTRALCAVTLLKEMATIAQAYGGSRTDSIETVYGLAGVGDLILSAFGTGGRNLSAGMQIATGRSINDLYAQSHVIPESLNTIIALEELIKVRKLNVPFFVMLAAVAQQKVPAFEFLNAL